MLGNILVIMVIQDNITTLVLVLNHLLQVAVAIIIILANILVMLLECNVLEKILTVSHMCHNNNT